MKTQLKKILIGAAALLFVMSGVSFAYDGHDRHHKPHRKAYGLYKAKKHHPYWNNKHFKPWRHYRDRYTREEIHHHHNYENNHRRWKKNHFKSRRPDRDRYIYKEVNHHYENHHRRRAPREDLIYKVALKDPGIVFKIIVKEH